MSHGYVSWSDSVPTAGVAMHTATQNSESMSWNRLAVLLADSEPENNSFAPDPAAALQRLMRTPNGPDCHETNSHL